MNRFIDRGKADLAADLMYEVPALAIFIFLGADSADAKLVKDLAGPRAVVNLCIACTGIKLDLDGKGVGKIELFEVTRAGEKVFHAVLEDLSATPEAGWNGFRPEYIDHAF